MRGWRGTTFPVAGPGPPTRSRTGPPGQAPRRAASPAGAASIAPSRSFARGHNAWAASCRD